MAIEKVRAILSRMAEQKKAVMCFECVNYEQLAWSIEAAEECGSPVILMLYFDMTFYTPRKVFLAMAKTLAESASVPVGITYVYADSMDLVMQAVGDGFPSVCVNLPPAKLETRIAETKRIVEAAHASSVDVTASPGEYEEVSAEDAVRFALETGIDGMVAPVVYGDKDNNMSFTETRHWYVSNVDYIDLSKLKAIHKALDLPLILHRSYNISEQQIRRALPYGIAEIDNGCPLDTRFFQAISSCAQDMDCGESYFALLLHAKEQMKEYISGQIQRAARADQKKKG